MNIKSIKHQVALVVAALAIIGTTACNERKFHVDGTIENAADSTLYFENMSLNGPVKVDSVKLSADGSFSFDGKAPSAPEFYRLRIAGQIINIAIQVWLRSMRLAARTIVPALRNWLLCRCSCRHRSMP